MANVNQRHIESNQIQRRVAIHRSREQRCGHKHVHGNRDSLFKINHFFMKESVQCKKMVNLNSINNTCFIAKGMLFLANLSVFPHVFLKKRIASILRLKSPAISSELRHSFRRAMHQSSATKG